MCLTVDIGSYNGPLKERRTNIIFLFMFRVLCSWPSYPNSCPNFNQHFDNMSPLCVLSCKCWWDLCEWKSTMGIWNLHNLYWFLIVLYHTWPMRDNPYHIFAIGDNAYHPCAMGDNPYHTHSMGNNPYHVSHGDNPYYICLIGNKVLLLSHGCMGDCLYPTCPMWVLSCNKVVPNLISNIS